MTSTEGGAHDDDVAGRLAELEALVASLGERLAIAEARTATPAGSTEPPARTTPALPTAVTASPPPPAGPLPAPPPSDRHADDETGQVGVGRRRLLTRAGTAAVGAVLGGAAVSVATASPAAAATGSFDSADTNTPALTTANTAGGVALRASTTGHPDNGPTVDIASNGEALRVVGTGIRSPIVVQHLSPALATFVLEGLESSLGVYAKAQNFGVYGEDVEGQKGTGVAGESHDGIAGVSGIGRKRAAGGIFESEQGVGLTGIGGKAQLALRHPTGLGSAMAPPRARADEHLAGEVYLDNDESLWLCVADGEPGTWVRITGPGAAGALHVLPAPVRVYDSRPGLAPATGPKTKLAARTPRPVDLTANASGVPVDATAATVTLTATATTDGSPSAPGFLAAYADGLAYPGTSNLNWTAPGTTIATTTTTALTNGRLALYASDRTDVIVDVIAYHR